MGHEFKKFDSWFTRFFTFLFEINMGGYVEWPRDPAAIADRREICNAITGWIFVLFNVVGHVLLWFGIFYDRLNPKCFFIDDPMKIDIAALFFFCLMASLLLLAPAFQRCCGGCCHDRSRWQFFWKMVYKYPMDENSPVLLVTDGGHFENLGGLKMLQLAKPVIVMMDAEEDPEIHMRSLHRMLRLGRDREYITSFEVKADPINIQVSAAAPHDECCSTQSVLEVAVTYASGAAGRIFYIKSNIRATDHTLHLEKVFNDRFPHDPTKNQEFDSHRFRAYLALGERCASDLLHYPH